MDVIHEQRSIIIFSWVLSQVRRGGFIAVEIEEFKSAAPTAWRGQLATGDEPILQPERDVTLNKGSSFLSRVMSREEAT